MFNIKVDYPTLDEEKKILWPTTKGETAGAEEGALGQGDRQPAEAGPSVPVCEYMVEYVTRLVRATRPADDRRRRSSSRTWSTGAPGPGPAST